LFFLRGRRSRRSGFASPPARRLGQRAVAIHTVQTHELERGFFALAFGSDLRIGARPRGIRRFDHPIRVAVIAGGSVDRSAAMARVIDDYARQVPGLQVSLATGSQPADVEVRLIDERDFRSALQATFGVQSPQRAIRNAPA
jgi:hypothetical protein